MQSKTKLLTPSEAAEALNIKTRRVYMLIKARRLTALRVGRQWRILMADLDRFIAEERQRAMQ